MRCVRASCAHSQPTCTTAMSSSITDPYFGGSHLPDRERARPAFHQGALLGYACLRAHWPDVGSARPAATAAVNADLREGLRMPPLRLYSRGALNVDLDG